MYLHRYARFTTKYTLPPSHNIHLSRYAARPWPDSATREKKERLYFSPRAPFIYPRRGQVMTFDFNMPWIIMRTTNAPNARNHTSAGWSHAKRKLWPRMKKMTFNSFVRTAHQVGTRCGHLACYFKFIFHSLTHRSCCSKLPQTWHWVPCVQVPLLLFCCCVFLLWHNSLLPSVPRLPSIERIRRRPQSTTALSGQPNLAFYRWDFFPFLTIIGWPQACRTAKGDSMPAWYISSTIRGRVRTWLWSV